MLTVTTHYKKCNRSNPQFEDAFDLFEGHTHPPFQGCVVVVSFVTLLGQQEPISRPQSSVTTNSWRMQVYYVHDFGNTLFLIVVVVLVEELTLAQIVDQFCWWLDGKNTYPQRPFLLDGNLEGFIFTSLRFFWNNSRSTRAARWLDVPFLLLLGGYYGTWGVVGNANSSVTGRAQNVG